MANDVVIVAATRTATGRFQGSLKQIAASQLGATVINSLIAQTNLPTHQIDEVIFGHVLTAGCGQNTARQASIFANIPYQSTAMTLNKVCGSGLKSVHLATQAILCKDAKVIIAGGMENMSLAPYLLLGNRRETKSGQGQIVDSIIHDGLWDQFNQYHMGITAENLAEKYHITREAQDIYAYSSHQKALQAIQQGIFKNEITPVELPNEQNHSSIFDTDEQPRTNTSLEKLAKLKPAFKKDGTVTAGNSSPFNDGAAAVMLITAPYANELQLPILGKIKAYASAGVDPAYMGIGPAEATKKCLKKAGWHIDELEVIEANEAFAVQTLAVSKILGWDMDKVNINGGAIALGHPIGASGCRVLVSLLYEMQRSNKHKGLATLCIGGGQGIAIAIERD